MKKHNCRVTVDRTVAQVAAGTVEHYMALVEAETDKRLMSQVYWFDRFEEEEGDSANAARRRVRNRLISLVMDKIRAEPGILEDANHEQLVEAAWPVVVAEEEVATYLRSRAVKEGDTALARAKRLRETLKSETTWNPFARDVVSAAFLQAGQRDPFARGRRRDASAAAGRREEPK